MVFQCSSSLVTTHSELEKSDLRQQINFIGKLERIDEEQCSLLLKNQKKRLLIFHKIL